MKIRHKLILGFLSVASLIAVAGYISVNTAEKALQKAIGKNSVVLARETLDKIDRTIQARIEQVEIYARDLMFEELLLNSNLEFDKLDDVQGYINQKEKEWISTSGEGITPSMARLIDNELAIELRKEMELKPFYQEKYGYPIFGEVFVTNKYGANVAQSRKTSDYYQADEQWWQQAARDGLYIGNIEYDKSAGIYALDVAVKICDVAGNFTGVVKAVLNIQEIINIIKEVELQVPYKTTKFRLLTKDLMVIYSTEGPEIRQGLSALEGPILHIVSGKLNGEGSFAKQDAIPGTPGKLFAYARSRGYKDFKGLEWILVVEHELGEIFAAVAKLKNTMLIISILLIVLSVLIGLFLSRAISEPIAKLKGIAIEIGKGKLDTKVEIESSDEIGQLAAAFRKMTGDLKKTTTSIDKLSREITERKKAEQALERLNKDLELTIQELERSNQQLRDFAHMTAHDLKTPLRGIATLAQWLSNDYSDKFDEPGKKQVKLLVARAQRISTMVDGILRFCQITPAVAKERMVDLNTVLTEVIRQINPPENFEIIVENHLPCVICQKKYMVQVFQSLLENAIKYIDRPDGRIKVSCVGQDSLWKFTVADNGPGIEQRYFKKIFQMFQRLSPRDEIESAGMGLSFVKKIVEMYGGQIWVRSKPGEGSAFLFTLPKQRWGGKNAKLEAHITGGR